MTVTHGDASDYLLGSDGVDTLIGETANNTLDSSAKNYTLVEDNTRDTFILTQGFGTDTITDFGNN